MSAWNSHTEVACKRSRMFEGDRQGLMDFRIGHLKNGSMSRYLGSTRTSSLLSLVGKFVTSRVSQPPCSSPVEALRSSRVSERCRYKLCDWHLSAVQSEVPLDESRE